MKRILALSAALLLISMPATHAANPKSGSACPKLQATKEFNGKLFTCVAKGKTRVWAAGTVLIDAGAFGVERKVSNNGGNAQPMECKASDGNQGFRSQKTFFVDPKNPNHLGVGIEFKGFYISSDAGATWNMSSAGLIGYPLASDTKKPCHTEFSVLATDPQKSSHLIVARAGEPGTIKDYFSENAGIYESNDGGKNWKQILTQAGIGVYVHDGLAFSHQNSQVIYAGTTTNGRKLDGGNAVYVKTGIVYKTIDGGKSWKELPTGAPADIGVQFISIDPTNDNLVTVSTFGRVKGSTGNTFGPGLGIIKTTDGGATWNPLNGISSLRAIGYDPVDKSGSSGLIADDSGAITKFDSNGQTLEKVASVPSLNNHSTRVTRLAISSDGSWYAADHYTNNSSHQVGFIFKSTDSGKNWIKILDTDTLK